MIRQEVVSNADTTFSIFKNLEVNTHFFFILSPPNKRHHFLYQPITRSITYYHYSNRYFLWAISYITWLLKYEQINSSLVRTNFFFFNNKLLIIKEKSITASSIYKNETCVYKIKTCIYSLCQIENNFSNKEKEVRS